MSIIEKLGITKGNHYYDGSEDGFILIKGKKVATACFVTKEDGMLYAAAPEMLEALIEIQESIDMSVDGPYYDIEPIIEKATGKTWNKIKELL